LTPRTLSPIIYSMSREFTFNNARHRRNEREKRNQGRLEAEENLYTQFKERLDHPTTQETLNILRDFQTQFLHTYTTKLQIRVPAKEAILVDKRLLKLYPDADKEGRYKFLEDGLNAEIVIDPAYGFSKSAEDNIHQFLPVDETLKLRFISTHERPITHGYSPKNSLGINFITEIDDKSLSIVGDRGKLTSPPVVFPLEEVTREKLEEEIENIVNIYRVTDKSLIETYAERIREARGKGFYTFERRINEFRETYEGKSPHEVSIKDLKEDGREALLLANKLILENRGQVGSWKKVKYPVHDDYLSHWGSYTEGFGVQSQSYVTSVDVWLHEIEGYEISLKTQKVKNPIMIFIPTRESESRIIDEKSWSSKRQMVKSGKNILGRQMYRKLDMEELEPSDVYVGTFPVDDDNSCIRKIEGSRVSDDYRDYFSRKTSRDALKELLVLSALELLD